MRAFAVFRSLSLVQLPLGKMSVKSLSPSTKTSSTSSKVVTNNQLEYNIKWFSGYGMTECVMGTHLPVLNVKDPYLGVGKAVSNLQQKVGWPCIINQLQCLSVGRCENRERSRYGRARRGSIPLFLISAGSFSVVGQIAYIDDGIPQSAWGNCGNNR